MVVNPDRVEAQFFGRLGGIDDIFDARRGPELGTLTPKEILFMARSYFFSVTSTLWYLRWRLYQSTTLAATSSK